jgi:ribosomal protein S18 acetylase RimI-like enzyme
MPAVRNPFWHALRGPLAPLALGDDLAVRFRPDVNVFGAVPDEPSEVSWKALAELVGPGELVVLAGEDLRAPGDWRTERVIPGVQYVARPGVGRADAEVVELIPEDAEEMVTLASATAPGPYLLHTIEQGGFVGFREEGRLVAMGGFRCRVPGATEISTVCTAPGFRGRGLAQRLVLHLVHQIEREGDVAFLHTGADNSAAITLYRKLGFVLTAQPDFIAVRPPEVGP